MVFNSLLMLFLIRTPASHKSPIKPPRSPHCALAENWGSPNLNITVFDALLISFRHIGLKLKFRDIGHAKIAQVESTECHRLKVRLRLTLSRLNRQQIDF